jgi:hypothetical protein
MPSVPLSDPIRLRSRRSRPCHLMSSAEIHALASLPSSPTSLTSLMTLSSPSSLSARQSLVRDLWPGARDPWSVIRDA